MKPGRGERQSYDAKGLPRRPKGYEAHDEGLKEARGERFSSNGSRISPSGLKIRYLPKIMVNMRIGGQSTGSLKNRLIANKNDRRAWQVNGVRPALGFRFLKPLRKLGQWL